MKMYLYIYKFCFELCDFCDVGIAVLFECTLNFWAMKLYKYLSLSNKRRNRAKISGIFSYIVRTT